MTKTVQLPSQSCTCLNLVLYILPFTVNAVMLSDLILHHLRSDGNDATNTLVTMDIPTARHTTPRVQDIRTLPLLDTSLHSHRWQRTQQQLKPAKPDRRQAYSTGCLWPIRLYYGCTNTHIQNESQVTQDILLTSVHAAMRPMRANPPHAEQS
jgi:hypothetical protein